MHNSFFTLSSLLFVAALGFFASIPLPTELSMQIAYFAIGLMVLLSLLPGPVWRVGFVTIGAFVVVRYILWRFDSLPLEAGILSAVAAVMLLGAEIYGVSQLLLGLFVNALPLNRKARPLPPDQANWPTVDVFIPTYTEPLDVVFPTILGAVGIEYPKHKLNIYVCDDGYPKSLKSEGLEKLELDQRTASLKAFCKRHGVNYVTRELNIHAKSGNMNNAMQHSKGDLILVLDADHVPTRNILKDMAGYFLHDEKLAFVQSPHFFVNPDPVERNLSLHGIMPSENDMFYKKVQCGLDLWNASLFCGSATLLSRAAILDIGGFAVDSITEDASTSIKLHSKGYNSAYHAKPLIAGLQPETFAGFIVQRLRWAMGMVQIFCSKNNPFLVKNLTTGQRIAYTSIISFWFFPFARVVFFLAPILSIVFEMTLYPVSMEYFIGYTVPYMIVVVMAFQRMFGKVRRFLISELYETLQGFFSLPAIFSVMLAPSKPTFKVTPKGEKLTEEYLSELSGPFYFFYALTFGGLLWGLYRFIVDEGSRSAVALSLGWIVFNLVLLNAALGVLVEKVQRRSRPRIEVNQKVAIRVNGVEAQAVLVDVSEKGALFSIPGLDLVGSFEVQHAGNWITCETLKHRWIPSQPDFHPVLFVPKDEVQEQLCVDIAYGDANRWAKAWDARENKKNLVVTFISLIVTGVKTAAKHYAHKFQIEG